MVDTITAAIGKTKESRRCCRRSSWWYMAQQAAGMRLDLESSTLYVQIKIVLKKE